MSKFGWDYPPGCSGPPEAPPYLCAFCGGDEDTCVCPECPECGDPGCLEHAPVHQLLDMEIILAARHLLVTDRLSRYQKQYNPYAKCTTCGVEEAVSLGDEGPFWCQVCNAHMDIHNYPKDERTV